MSDESLSLPDLAKAIAASWNKYDDYIVTVAMYLKEASDRVERGEAGEGVFFKDWCKEHVLTKDGKPRSFAEIKRLISYAESPDVADKVAKRREQINAARKTRRQSAVSTPQGRDFRPSNLSWPERAALASNAAAVLGDDPPPADFAMLELAETAAKYWQKIVERIREGLDNDTAPAKAA